MNPDNSRIINFSPPAPTTNAPASDEFIGPRPPPKTFEMWSPAQFLAYIADPSACLLGDGYLEKGQWTSFVGAGGLGKTRLILWLVISQMTGQDWCGLKVAGEPQKVAILSTENGLKRWQNDLKKIFSLLTPDQQALVQDRLRILALTPDEPADLNLGDEEVRDRLRNTLQAHAPGIVVFDPLADMLEGDESKTSDMKNSLLLLRGVTRKACPTAAIIIIHHARTGAQNIAQAGSNFNAGNFARGSKVLYSSVRCELQLVPCDDKDATKLVLMCGKANDVAKFPPRAITFDPETFRYTVEEDFDIDAWRADVNGKRHKEAGLTIAQVVTAVREIAPMVGDEASMKKIAEALADTGASLRNIQRIVNQAVKAGYLRDGSKRSLYRLGAKPLPR